MRIFEITNPKLKSKIMRAIDNLSDDDPLVPSILQHVKGTLYQGNLEKFLEESGIKERLGDNKAYAFFKTSLANLQASLEEKINLLVLMKNPANLMKKTIFMSNTSGNILDQTDGIGEKIKNNKVFQALAGPIWQFTIGGQGGMGPGELFLALFSGGSLQPNKRGKDAEGGDVNVDGLVIEIKSGGVVSPKKGKHVVVDRLNDNLKTKAKQLELGKKYPDFEILMSKKGKGSGTNFEGGWLPLFFQLYANEVGETAALELFTHYLKTLYPPIPDDVIHQMFKKLGNGATELLAPVIFKMCQADYKWHSIFVAGPNLDFCNLIDFDQALPPGLNYKISLKRGQDSNATADGYMVVSYGEPVPASDGNEDNEVVTVSVKKSTSAKNKREAEANQRKADAIKRKENAATLIDADNQFLEKLKDPSNPLTQSWRKYTGDKVAAKDEVLNLIAAGKSDQELAQDLENTIYEHEIRRMKQLFS